MTFFEIGYRETRDTGEVIYAWKNRSQPKLMDCIPGEPARFFESLSLKAVVDPRALELTALKYGFVKDSIRDSGSGIITGSRLVAPQFQAQLAYALYLHAKDQLIRFEDITQAGIASLTFPEFNPSPTEEIRKQEENSAKWEGGIASTAVAALVSIYFGKSTMLADAQTWYQALTYTGAMVGLTAILFPIIKGKMNVERQHDLAQRCHGDAKRRLLSEAGRILMVHRALEETS